MLFFKPTKDSSRSTRFYAHSPHQSMNSFTATSEEACSRSCRVTCHRWMASTPGQAPLRFQSGSRFPAEAWTIRSRLLHETGFHLRSSHSTGFMKPSSCLASDRVTPGFTGPAPAMTLRPTFLFCLVKSGVVGRDQMTFHVCSAFTSLRSTPPLDSCGELGKLHVHN